MMNANAKSILQEIASTRLTDNVSSSYNGVDSALRHMGAPTNNTLLSLIHAETKRNADECRRINRRINELTESISAMNNILSSIVVLLERQNEILSDTRAIGSPATSKSNPSGDWFYQGTTEQIMRRVVMVLMNAQISETFNNKIPYNPMSRLDFALRCVHTRDRKSVV